MSLLRFFQWLATTPGSIALHESLYVYLIVSTVHVVTLSVFVEYLDGRKVFMGGSAPGANGGGSAAATSR